MSLSVAWIELIVRVLLVVVALGQVVDQAVEIGAALLRFGATLASMSGSDAPDGGDQFGNDGAQFRDGFASAFVKQATLLFAQGAQLLDDVVLHRGARLACARPQATR
ncbi:hypothetical protein LP419_37455 [Massilia sp. H-1]|nr:hypothetical protein LP419_37455 [Massilia sp. H-1]